MTTAVPTIVGALEPLGLSENSQIDAYVDAYFISFGNLSAGQLQCRIANPISENHLARSILTSVVKVFKELSIALTRDRPLSVVTPIVFIAGRGKINRAPLVSHFLGAIYDAAAAIRLFGVRMFRVSIVAWGIFAIILDGAAGFHRMAHFVGASHQGGKRKGKNTQKKKRIFHF